MPHTEDVQILDNSKKTKIGLYKTYAPITLEVFLLTTATLFMLFPSHITPLGLLLLSVQAILRRKRTGHWLLWSPFTPAISLLLVMSLVGVAVAPDKALGLNRLSVLLLGVATFYTVAEFIRSVQDMIRIAVIIIGLGVVVACLSLIVTGWPVGVLVKSSSILEYMPLLLHLPNSGVPTFHEGVSPRLVGGTMAFLLPLALSMLVWGQGKALRIFSGLSALVIAFPLVLSQSPQAYLGLIMALALMLAWHFPRSLLVQIPLAFAVVFTWQQSRWQLSPPLVERLEIGIAARFTIWPKACLMIRDMPITGSGLNNFPVMDMNMNVL